MFKKFYLSYSEKCLSEHNLMCPSEQNTQKVSFRTWCHNMPQICEFRKMFSIILLTPWYVESDNVMIISSQHQSRTQHRLKLWWPLNRWMRLQAVLPLHRGAFCMFSFQWIYYHGSNKSTGKETGKTHLYALYCTKLKKIDFSFCLSIFQN